MREKPIFEEVSKQLVCQPQFWIKWLIGGILSFIPLFNVFAFGYLYRFSAQLRRTGEVSLPEWNDWKGLFIDGLKFGLIWLVYWLLPIFLGYVLSMLFDSLGFGAFAYLPLKATFFMAPILFCSALYRFHMEPNFGVLLEVDYITRMSRAGFGAYILPILVFSGIFFLTLPLYGIAFFSGFLSLITQLSSRYRSFELQK